MSGKKSNCRPQTPQRGLVSLQKWICQRTSVSLTAGFILIRKSGNEDKRHRRISHGAEVHCVGPGGAKEWGMMDAHSQLMQGRGIPVGAWPGGYCNQADRVEDLNADLLQHEGKCNAPAYEWMDDRCRTLFVRLRKPVREGEEILIF